MNMNMVLFPNELELDFYFQPYEIFKSDEDIKFCIFNDYGSLLLIVLKSNVIKMFEFLGKNILFNINYFKETEKIINHLIWSLDSNFLCVNYYCESKKLYGITIIEINNSLENLFKIINDYEYNFTISKIKFENSISKIPNILLSGNCPQIININNLKITQFFKQPLKNKNFIIDISCEKNFFFLFLKDVFCILLIKFCPTPNDFDVKKIYTKEIQEIKEVLDDNFIIYDFLSIESNGEISNVQIDITKSLILVNCTDRILRLFKFNYEYENKSVSLIKEYFDSVNRKKWLNSYFYTYKNKNTFQDLILSSLADNNSLELILIDINTGNFIKRLEPFKYQCNDFVCHYKNHYSIILISNKKLFLIYGYLINNWGAYAPQFKYIDDNIEFIEEEGYFDKKINKKQILGVYDKSFIKSLFKSKKLLNKITIKQNNHLVVDDEITEKEHTDNLFFKFNTNENDPLIAKSEKELKEVMDLFNEIIEIKKN